MHSHMYTRGRGLPPSLADFWNFGLTPDHTSSLGDKIRSIHGVQGARRACISHVAAATASGPTLQ
jgi:hypothetical protein